MEYAIVLVRWVANGMLDTHTVTVPRNTAEDYE